MKANFFLSFPVLVSAAAVRHSLSTRQTGIQVPDLGGLVQGLSGALQALTQVKAPTNTKKLTPQIDNGAIREQVLWGPYKLNPANGTHMGGLDPKSDNIGSNLGGICSECMILAAKISLAHGDGSNAGIESGVYAHHVLMINYGRDMVAPAVMPSCAGGYNPGGLGSFPGLPATSPVSATTGQDHVGGMRAKRQFGIPGIPIAPFLIQGDDASSTKFESEGSDLKSGFYVGKGDSMNINAEVVNYDNAPKDIYISLDYEYLPSLPNRPDEYYDVGLGMLTVSPCEGLNLDIPTDKAVKFTGPGFNVTRDGYILDIKPHLHDGGANITFIVNDKPACTSNAVYGGTNGQATVNGQTWETITAYTPCGQPIPVKAGDKVAMDSWYDATEHTL